MGENLEGRECPKCGGVMVNEALEWRCPRCGHTLCIEPEYCPPKKKGVRSERKRMPKK
jgi:predicted RNA-binding Zn-ribbon protein involved in translation (DUF1610 family)